MNACPRIKLGFVSGVFGIQGWIKIYSDTDPWDNILDFDSWLLGGKNQVERFFIEAGGRHGKAIVAKLAGIDTRDEAARLIGREIFVNRVDLPELQENKFYWTDLVGLNVVTVDGIGLGVVDDMMETGAHDVLVVRGDRERLIPFVLDRIVRSVDLEQKCMVVAWDPDF